MDFANLCGKIMFEDNFYSTEYRYDRYGNLIGIKYPGSNDWLEYSYDRFNLLEGIENIGWI